MINYSSLMIDWPPEGPYSPPLLPTCMCSARCTAATAGSCVRAAQYRAKPCGANGCQRTRGGDLRRRPRRLPAGGLVIGPNQSIGRTARQRSRAERSGAGWASRSLARYSGVLTGRKRAAAGGGDRLPAGIGGIGTDNGASIDRVEPTGADGMGWRCAGDGGRRGRGGVASRPSRSTCSV
jgi:hypothetical protein